MINYNDENEHRATVAEHIEAIGEVLKEFTKNNTAEDIALCSDVLGYIAEALAVLHEKNRGDIVTLEYRDMIGFIIKD